MNQLEFYAVNPFPTIDTSKDSIQKFGYDDYKRMEAANNPVYAPRLIATKDAWQQLFGNLDTYDSNKSKQQGFTEQLNAKRKEFVDKAVDLEDLVAFKFKDTPGVHQQMYPHGRDEYYHATQENIFHLMNRMIEGTHNYPTELGATTEAEFQKINDDYQVIWDLQRAMKGDVSAAIPDYDVKVNILFDELYLNMLVILAANYKNPKAMLAFFDQTIVNYVSHTHPLLVQKKSQEASDLTFKVGDTIVLTSKFSGVVKYFFAPTADATSGTPPNELASKIKKKIPAAEAGAPENKFIIFINETDTDAHVEVRID